MLTIGGIIQNGIKPTVNRIKIVAGCFHFSADLSNGRNSLLRVLEATYQRGYNHITLFFLGDATGNQNHDAAAEAAEEIAINQVFDEVETWANTNGVVIYIKFLMGNHDGLDGDNSFIASVFQPQVTYTSDPYETVIEPGKTILDRYYVRDGTNLFYMSSDKQNIPEESGGVLGNVGSGGGRPTGAWLKSDVFHFVNTVLRNYDLNVFFMSHQAPIETSIASGVGDLYPLHNTNPIALSDGNGSVYVVYDDVADTAQIGFDILKLLRTQWSGFYSAGFSSHTHAPIEETFKNKSHIEVVDGVTQCNSGCGTQWHGINSLPSQHPHYTEIVETVGASTMELRRILAEPKTIEGQLYDFGEEYLPYRTTIPLKVPYYKAINRATPERPSEPIVSASRVGSDVTFDFTGSSDGFVVISSASPITFTPTDDESGVPSYEVAPGEVMRYQGNLITAIISTSDTYFRVYSLNGGNNQILYSTYVDLSV